MTNITETPRMKWPYMQWNADWQAWQRKMESMISAQDSDVFSNVEGRTNIFKQIPNASIIDDAGVYKLSIASDLILISRTLNVTATVDTTDDLVLEPNTIITAIIRSGAAGPQDTTFELRSTVPSSADIRVFGYVDQDRAINWFNGAKLTLGDSARPIFSFLVAAGTETNKVSVTGADTTPDFLRAKVQSTDGSVVITTVNPGANEKVDLSVPGVGTDEKTKVSAADSATGYLDGKVRGRAGIKLASADKGGGNLAIDFSYGDDHTIMVERDTDPAVSGQRLVDAYDAAKLITPLDAENRVKIVLLAGEYDVPAIFPIDTDFIDIICEQEVAMAGGNGAPTSDDFTPAGAKIEFVAGTTSTCVITCSDTILRGIDFAISTEEPAIDFDCALSGGFNGPKVFLKGCSCSGTSLNGLFASDFAGGIEDCFFNGDFGNDGAFNGTAIRVIGRGSLFPNDIDGARIENCESGSYGFAGGSEGSYSISNSIMKRCTNWSDDAFGNDSISNTLMEDCRNEGSGIGFGFGSVDASSTFINCYCDEITSPIGSDGTGFAGKMFGCHFGDNGDSVVTIAATGAEIYNSRFYSSVGQLVGNYSITGATGSKLRIGSCYLENSLSPDVTLTDDVSRESNKMPPAPWENKIVLEDRGDWTSNKDDLLRALEYAVSMSPGGVAKSSTNRVSIELAAAKYEFDSSDAYQITLDDTYDFIDLVGKGVAGKKNWDSAPYRGDVILPNTHIYTSYQGSTLFSIDGASDMRFSNIHFMDSGYLYGNAFENVGTDEAENFVFNDCVFDSSRGMRGISSITLANPPVLTLASSMTAITDPQWLSITGVAGGGMVEIPDGSYRAISDGSTVTLLDLDATGFTPYVSGGEVAAGAYQQSTCFLNTSGALSCYFKNCHFIGKVYFVNQAFKGSIIDCSFTDDSFANGLDGVYAENCRFGNGFGNSTGVYSEGTIIKRCKSWAVSGPGYYHQSNCLINIEDFEFFGSALIGGSVTNNNAKLKNVTALYLTQEIKFSEYFLAENCKFKRIDAGIVFDSTAVSWSIAAIATQIPPSTGVDGTVRFTTSTAHDFVAGDRIGFCHFDYHYDDTGASGLNQRTMIIDSVSDTTHFDVKMELVGGVYSFYNGGGWVGKVGSKLIDCEITATPTDNFDPNNNDPVFYRSTDPGGLLMIKGCRIGPAEVPTFLESGDIVLFDCKSYDNDLLLPHTNEDEIIVYGHNTLSEIERGRMFILALKFSQNMFPGRRYQRNRDQRLKISLGPYKYHFNDLEEFGGYILLAGAENDCLDIVGVGDVDIPNHGMKIDINDVVKPMTHLMYTGSGYLFTFDIKHVGLYNMFIERETTESLTGLFYFSSRSENVSFENIVTRKPYSYETITGITNANPGVATVSGGHNYRNGDSFFLNLITPMPELSNAWYTIDNATPTTFELKNIDTSAFAPYAGGGIAATVQGDCIAWQSAIDKLSMKNCYIAGNIDCVFSNTELRLIDCVIDGRAPIGSMFSGYMENTIVNGPGPCTLGGVYMDENSRFKGCLFHQETLDYGGFFNGVIEDCTFMRNFCNGNGSPSSGKLYRCKMMNQSSIGFLRVTSGAIIEDCVFYIYNATSVIDITNFNYPRPVITRTRFVDPDGLMVPGVNFSLFENSGSGSEVRVSYCELRNGIEPGLINILGAAYNIET